MDENMRHQAMNLCAAIFVIPLFLGFLESLPGDAFASSSVLQQYCNDKYMYCVNIPRSGKAVPHEGDAPKHGITIQLPQTGEEIWTYAHWDAALLQGSQKAALRQIEIIFSEHPDTDVSMASTRLADLSAYHLRFSYAGLQPITEEIIIAYRKSKDQSKETGIIYEIGMKCASSTCKVSAATFESFVSTFRLTDK